MNFKRVFIGCTLLLYNLTSFASTDSMKGSNAYYKCMLQVDSHLIVLDTSGKLIIWNINTLTKESHRLSTQRKFTALAKDRNGHTFLGTNQGEVWKLHPLQDSLSFCAATNFRTPILFIIFNSKNELFLILDHCVYDPISRATWREFCHDPIEIHVQVVKRFWFFLPSFETHTYLGNPDCVFIDKKDKIWMITSFGEFGGSIQLFDTQLKRELTTHFMGLDYGLFHPNSVFKDLRDRVYITSGLQHFSNSGDIFRFEDSFAFYSFQGNKFMDTAQINPFRSTPYIGPAAYDSVKHQVYFATTDGIFKANLSHYGELETPELLFVPQLQWERGSYSVGIGMTIKKMEITPDGRLLFLTKNNGIGIFHEARVQMLH